MKNCFLVVRDNLLFFIHLIRAYPFNPRSSSPNSFRFFSVSSVISVVNRGQER